MNCASSERVTNFSEKKMPLLETIWYWLQKVAKSEAWTIFDKFQFLDEF